MKPEEAKDILSDMRDQHLCFLGKSEIKDEWQEKYLKEAWACDSGAKTLAGLITGIKIDKGVIAESILHYGKNNQSTVCMEECAELIQPIAQSHAFVVAMWMQKKIRKPKLKKHSCLFQRKKCLSILTFSRKPCLADLERTL